MLLSIGLAVMIAAQRGGVHTIDTSLSRPGGLLGSTLPPASAPASAPSPSVPLADQPVAPPVSGVTPGGIPALSPTPTLAPEVRAPGPEAKAPAARQPAAAGPAPARKAAAPEGRPAATLDAGGPKPAAPARVEVKPGTASPVAPPPAATGNSGQ